MVGEVFVLNFDGSLANWLGSPSTCVFRPTCGQGLALERNGDLYCCDHFVEPDYLLGNILETPLVDLVSSEKQTPLRPGQKRQAAAVLPPLRGCSLPATASAPRTAS